jgi:hypothetical protein
MQSLWLAYQCAVTVFQGPVVPPMNEPFSSGEAAGSRH